MLTLSRRVGERFDWPLFLAVVAIGVLGVINLYSATSVYVDAGRRAGLADVYVSQIYWLVLGVMFAIPAAAVDYRHLQSGAYLLYGAGILSLAAVFVFGADIRGSSRWIQLGSFTFQPSEFMKILLIVVLAKWLHDDSRSEPRTLRQFAKPIALVALPVALVMAQPDLGTSMIYLLTALTMLSLVKVRWQSLATAGIMGAVAIPLAWLYVLQDYQKARVSSFLNPEADASGSGWHALQARTAIGNGGFTGEGYMQGAQNQFGFLPDQYSDFPFAVFAEDWGLGGGTFLLVLYAFVCLWSVRIAAQARDRFGAALAVGVGAMFLWHTLFNLGMCLGLFPVVGITLPLFSYGGSSMVTMLMGLGLLMNVSVRR